MPRLIATPPARMTLPAPPSRWRTAAAYDPEKVTGFICSTQRPFAYVSTSHSYSDKQVLGRMKFRTGRRFSQKNPPDSGGARPESALSPMTFSL
jgi:hypothetical protein